MADPGTDDGAPEARETADPGTDDGAPKSRETADPALLAATDPAADPGTDDGAPAPAASIAAISAAPAASAA